MTRPAEVSKPVTAAIVDDNEKERAFFAGLIRNARRVRLAGEFASGETALAELSRLAPDVVLIEINLPGMNGVECVRRLRLALPGSRFLMLTGCEDSDFLLASLRAGAGGYLLKRAAAPHLLEAIEDLHAGGAPLSPQIARHLVALFAAPAQPNSVLARLTPGEREFLRQLAKGFTYKEIADRMDIAMDTVRSYVRGVYQKLQVHSRTAAVVKYLNHLAPK